MGPSSWKKQRNGWKSWGLSVFSWELVENGRKKFIWFLNSYIQLPIFKSRTFSPLTIDVNPALYIKPLVLKYICLGFGPERPH